MECHGDSMENFTRFSAWNSVGYKAGTAVWQDRPLFFNLWLF